VPLRAISGMHNQYLRLHIYAASNAENAMTVAGDIIPDISSLLLPSYTFPSLISDWSTAIHADTDQWIEIDFYFLPEKMKHKYRLSNFGKISARCFPQMPTYRHLQVAAKFMLWGTIFDDYFEFHSKEELYALHQRALDILHGSQAGNYETPFFPILSDLRDELLRLMPDYWLKRFSKCGDTDRQYDG
jgi:hypothetical protein